MFLNQNNFFTILDSIIEGYEDVEQKLHDLLLNIESKLNNDNEEEFTNIINDIESCTNDLSILVDLIEPDKL